LLLFFPISCTSSRSKGITTHRSNVHFRSLRAAHYSVNLLIYICKYSYLWISKITLFHWKSLILFVFMLWFSNCIIHLCFFTYHMKMFTLIIGINILLHVQCRLSYLCKNMLKLWLFGILRFPWLPNPSNLNSKKQFGILNI